LCECGRLVEEPTYAGKCTEILVERAILHHDDDEVFDIGHLKFLRRLTCAIPPSPTLYHLRIITVLRQLTHGISGSIAFREVFLLCSGREDLSKRIRK
jgi:hypothetical protein